jgi:putative Holliday junction resolvase
VNQEINLPTTGRLVAVDYGTVRIGLAITDQGQSLASPFGQYQPRNERLDRQYFVDLVGQERVVGFVVGLPVHLDGRDSQLSVRAEEFARWLREATGIPVKMFDERFTTAFADEIIREAGLTRGKAKQMRDKLAAQILLTTFLESTRASRDSSKPSAPKGLE